MTGMYYFVRALILADFKWNFSENASAEEINALHERVAARLHYVCTANGGKPFSCDNVL